MSKASVNGIPGSSTTASEKERPSKLRDRMRNPFQSKRSESTASRDENIANGIATQAPISKPTSKSGAFIKYKNLYHNKDDNDVVFSQDSFEPIVDKNVDATETLPAFEVIKSFTTLRTYYPFEDKDFASPPPHFGVSHNSIIIRSAELMGVLRELTHYYPAVNLAGDTLQVYEPYQFLVHHYDGLQARRADLKNSSHASKPGTGDDDTYKQIGLLLKFLDENIMEDVKAEYIRHEKGVATFDMLWLLLRPGIDAAVFNSDPKRKRAVTNRDGAIMASITGGPSPSYRLNWSITTWCLEFDGAFISRRESTMLIAPFYEEKAIAELEVLPLSMAPAPEGHTSLQKYLSDQGKKWFNLLKPVSMHHRGQILQYPFYEMEGLVMIDLPTYVELNPEAVDDRWYKTALITLESVGTARQKTEPYIGWDYIRPELMTELSDRQYTMCPQKIPAYFFKLRQGLDVDVNNLSPAKFDSKMINSLVIDKKRMDLLKALASHFMGIQTTANGSIEGHQSWKADFVKGKENAEIFLLHGQSGVGKTFTAECISEFTKRPLMSLTCSDIGTRPEVVEENLQERFKLAKRWGAIMLIDEADIYLEKRSQTDLTRNGLVAGFLRALEVYEGILFLTTNRVGAFDDAFISRIHVKLYYPLLTLADRQTIWNNFMDKLTDDRGDTMKITEEVREFISESEIISKLKLNGREIRNIFQTAVGLAEFENKKDAQGRTLLKREHIRQVADMSGEFKEYLVNVLGHDESERAYRSFMRADGEDQQSQLGASSRLA